MKDHNSIIQRETQALDSLISAIPILIADAFSQQQLADIIEREIFTPSEDEEIAYWFARFITLRSSLWMIVDTAILNTGGMDKLLKPIDWQYFVLGYSAVCSLRHLDRFLTTKIAKQSIVQRKLNEAFPVHRVERKQYSDIYSEMMLPSNVILIHQAHRRLDKYKAQIELAVMGSPVEHVYADLQKQERYIDLSKGNYFVAWVRYRLHSLRRRGASAKQKSVFHALEYSGRLVSELALPRTKKVTLEILAELESILQPGDIFVTRHRQALTNLFLPGYWPHAALYVGSESDRETLNIEADPKHLEYWNGENRTFEALKDGVHFRPLEETLSVDAFVVLRPNLTEKQISEAIGRVIVHAGKGYNFDFDFFRSDHLVCTEVIYRAYDEINDFSIPLQERMGRKALSAENILDLALDTSWASPIAIFGVGESKHELVTDERINGILIGSYRDPVKDPVLSVRIS